MWWISQDFIGFCASLQHYITSSPDSAFLHISLKFCCCRYCQLHSEITFFFHHWRKFWECERKSLPNRSSISSASILSYEIFWNFLVSAFAINIIVVEYLKEVERFPFRIMIYRPFFLSNLSFFYFSFHVFSFFFSEWFSRVVSKEWTMEEKVEKRKSNFTSLSHKKKGTATNFNVKWRIRTQLELFQLPSSSSFLFREHSTESRVNRVRWCIFLWARLMINVPKSPQRQYRVYSSTDKRAISALNFRVVFMTW